MTHINLIKRVFVRQSAEYDCGIACLKMSFGYYGLQLPATATHGNFGDALSLTDMKAISIANGIAARAVEMELSYLKTLQKPVILHVLNDQDREHFVVCFQAVSRGNKTSFLIADPAKQVYYIDEEELKAKWVSQAALYFEIGDKQAAIQHPNSWVILWQMCNLPVGLIPVFSVLSLIAAAFGVGMSWLLQRGTYDTRLVQGPVMIAVLLLLFIVYVGRAAANYIKQYLLIKMNLRLNAVLIDKLITKVFGTNNEGIAKELSVGNNLRDIQRVQAAASGFIAVLCSDGTLIAALLGAVLYFLPLAGLIDLLTFVLASTLIIKFTKEHVADNINLNYLSRSAEDLLSSDYQLLKQAADANNQEMISTKHAANFIATMQNAERVGISLARISLTLDLVQTLNLAIIFFIGFWQFHNSLISYNELMITVILSYLLSAIIPKILNAFIVLYEGMDAAIQLNRILGS